MNQVIINIYRLLKSLINKIPLFDKILITIFIIVGFVYVGNNWSPSSYSIVLNQINAKNSGLIWGIPHILYVDEWAMLTPLTQVTVNNHFNRFNNTSPYNEDLRMYLSLPIFDWGLIFKPTMWLYPFLNPALAFSSHHYFLIILFVYGYTIFFRFIFSYSSINSLLLALILFFTGASQYWWTMSGPTISFFPWLFIALNFKTNIAIKFILLYWIIACWLISFFYPPLFLPFIFIFLFIIFSFRKTLLTSKELKILWIPVIASIFSVFLYLKDYIMLTRYTLYPGLRRLTGGGLHFESFISNFLPTLHSHSIGKLFYPEPWVIGGIFGSYYILCVFCFLNYKNIVENNSENKKQILFLTFGLLLMYSWMFLPIPSVFGKVFLWDRVQPCRMAIAASLLLFIIASLSANLFGLIFSIKRFIFFFFVTLGGWYYYVFLQSHFNIWHLILDVGIVLPVGATILLRYKYPGINSYRLILTICLLFGFSSFIPYFTIQSAQPIFNREKTSVTTHLDQLTRDSQHNVLAVPDFYGAILNGLGYKSVSHILAVPQLEFWRKLFPKLPIEEFNFIFNRFAAIMPVNYICTPHSTWFSEIEIPVKIFNSNFKPQRKILNKYFKNPGAFKVSGNIDHITQDGHKMIITGWAPWINISSSQILYIMTNHKIRKMRLDTLPRRDVAFAYNETKYINSGFRLEIIWNSKKYFPPFLLIAEDEKERILINNSYHESMHYAPFR